MLLAAGAALLVLAALWNGQDAKAVSGPCNPTTAAVTAEEQEFLGLLQSWRDANIANSGPLTLSGPLNAAAAMFAEYQVSAGAPGGHYDNLGRYFNDRARDCGYPAPYYNGIGEGIYGVASSGGISVPPSAAIQGITYAGSGVYITAVSPPVKCVGVAVARNASGSTTVWVTLIAQFPASQGCPDAATTTQSTATASPSASATATGTRTATPTATATATPTATPTPIVYRLRLPQSACDSCPGASEGATPTPTATNVTPSPTSTHTPTPSPSPTRTAVATVTPAASCNATAQIVAMNKTGEWVDIEGSGTMTGWYLVSTNGSERFTFPAGYVLAGTVRIRSAQSEFFGRPGELWWTTDSVWDNHANDDAELHDCTGGLVSFLDDGG